MKVADRDSVSGKKKKSKTTQLSRYRLPPRIEESVVKQPTAFFPGGKKVWQLLAGEQLPVGPVFFSTPEAQGWLLVGAVDGGAVDERGDAVELLHVLALLVTVHVGARELQASPGKKPKIFQDS